MRTSAFGLLSSLCAEGGEAVALIGRDRGRKGTNHSTRAEEPDYSELGNGLDVTSTNRSTQKQVITEGPGSGSGDVR